jgi:hypothetical protein
MALLCAVFALAACDGRRTQVVRITPKPQIQQQVNYASVESPSLQFLPRRDEAPGWKLEEDPIVVPKEHILDYLGGAEGRTFADYQTLDDTVGKYSSTAGSGFATVEIFRFPDFVKAFGAYSIQKEGMPQYINIPNEAFAKPHSVHIWRGPFYVRVIGQGPGGSIVKLASFVADRMPPAPGKPAIFAFLPDKGRVPNSERYSAEKGLGQSFLGNSFQAKFDLDGDVVDGLVIPAANKPAAGQILNLYKNLYVRNGKLLDPIPNLGEDNFTAEDRYLGRVVAFRIDRFVVAFNGYKDRQHLIDLSTQADQKILGTIRKQLVTADNEADNTSRRSNDKSTVPAWAQRPR